MKDLLNNFTDREIKGLCFFANQIEGMGVVVNPDNLEHVKVSAMINYFLTATFNYHGALLMVKFLEAANQ